MVALIPTLLQECYREVTIAQMSDGILHILLHSKKVIIGLRV